MDIRTNRTLPAFTRCSIDGKLGTAKLKPRAQYEKEKKEAAEWNKTNPRRQKRADKYDGDSSGMANGWLYWDTADENIVDEADKWSLILAVVPKAPADECTVDVTPRRCTKFKAAPGQEFTWTNDQKPTLAGSAQWRQVQTGTAKADKWGLVTLEQVKVTQPGNRITLRRKP